MLNQGVYILQLPALTFQFPKTSKLIRSGLTVPSGLYYHLEEIIDRIWRAHEGEHISWPKLLMKPIRCVEV